MTQGGRSRSRGGVRWVEGDLLAAAHGLADALQRVGALDADDMRYLDQLCLTPRPDCGASEIKRGVEKAT